MLPLIFKCFWLLLPAALSNTFASFGSKLPGSLGLFGKPINEKLFGSHKTYRGFVVGIPIGILVAWIQSLLYSNFSFFFQNTLIDYSKINFALIGFLMAAGALMGDLIKSFFKRRFGKRPGEPWFPWDEVDWIAGALLFTSFVYFPPLDVLAITFFIYILIHLCSNMVAYFTGIKEKPKLPSC